MNTASPSTKCAPEEWCPKWVCRAKCIFIIIRRLFISHSLRRAQVQFSRGLHEKWYCKDWTQDRWKPNCFKMFVLTSSMVNIKRYNPHEQKLFGVFHNLCVTGSWDKNVLSTAAQPVNKFDIIITYYEYCILQTGPLWSSLSTGKYIQVSKPFKKPL